MNQVEKFRAAIRPYNGEWAFIDVRSICVKAFGKWVNLATRIILSDDSLKGVGETNSLPMFSGFGVLREVLQIEKLNDLIAQMEKGVISIADQEVYFATIENNEVKNSAGSYSFQRNKGRSRLGLADCNFPTFILSKSGESIQNLLSVHPDVIEQETLDRKLRCLDVPYDGLDDLFTSFLQIPKPAFGRALESTLVDIIAPIKIRLASGCRLTQSKVTIIVEAVGPTKLNNASIGLIDFSDKVVGRRSYELIESDWSRDGDCFIARKEVILGNVSSAIIFIRFREDVFDRVVVNDPAMLLNNPRILAYSYFDENLTILRQYLNGSKGTEFEIGVGVLLHFCGFNVGAYGRVKGEKGTSSIQEEIDLLAFTPFSNDVVAVECTTKDLNPREKISKLSRRVKEIRERLPEFLITPLIFTSCKKDLISTSDLTKANTEGIGVVASEEIQELLKMTEAQKQPNEVLGYLQGLIPKDFWESVFKAGLTTL